MAKKTSELTAAGVACLGLAFSAVFLGLFLAMATGTTRAQAREIIPGWMLAVWCSVFIVGAIFMVVGIYNEES